MLFFQPKTPIIRIFTGQKNITFLPEAGKIYSETFEDYFQTSQVEENIMTDIILNLLIRLCIIIRLHDTYNRQMIIAGNECQ